MSHKLIENEKLVSEWNYEKNETLNLNELLSGSNLKAWWKCEKGHEWQAVITSRANNGYGCPYCSNRKVLSGYNDLVTTNYELSLEWNDEKNDYSPTEVSANSHKHVWWKCRKCGYEWQAEVKSRNHGNGCPKCGVSKQSYTQMVNATRNNRSLEATNPLLAKEWNYERNGEITPNIVSAGSNRKAWWKCEKGHEWQAVISSRKNGFGCPYCAKETQTSFAEQTIYFYMVNLFGDVFNRYILDDQEIDIFIPKYKIGIEYDGAKYHNNNDSLAREQRKYHVLKQHNLILIRIREFFEEKYNVDCADYYLGYSNGLKNNNLENIVYDLTSLISDIIGVKCHCAINIEQDRNSIYNSYIKCEKANSLFEKKPELLKYWNFEKNKELTPRMVSAGSNKKVWWKCEKGHEWQAVISSRSSNSGCPYCLNQRFLKGFNDLRTKSPSLASEWDVQRNDKTPDDTLAAGSKKVWWVCSKCGKNWKASIGSRIKGNGCPSCKLVIISEKQKAFALKQSGSLYDNHPSLLCEWDFTKNIDVDPKTITSASNTKVWWVCSKCGYEWQALVSDRTRGKGCAKCGRKRAVEKRREQAIKDKGSLFDNYPYLMTDWDYDKNKEHDPNRMLVGSNEKVWWKCSKCGYEWEAVIASRTLSNNGCPQCAKNNKHKVIQYDLFGNIIAEYESVSEASRMTSVHITTISNVCKGKAKTAGGYVWRYK